MYNRANLKGFPWSYPCIPTSLSALSVRVMKEVKRQPRLGLNRLSGLRINTMLAKNPAVSAQMLIQTPPSSQQHQKQYFSHLTDGKKKKKTCLEKISILVKGTITKESWNSAQVDLNQSLLCAWETTDNFWGDSFSRVVDVEKRLSYLSNIYWEGWDF